VKRWGAVIFGCLVAVASLSAPAARAQAPAPGATLLEICTESGIPGIPELGPRTCKSIESGSTLVAQLCEQLAPPDACAQLSDGRVIDPALVTAFANSWAGQALRLQEHLDDDQPLRNSLILSTHNSFNASVYDTNLSTIDPNQRYSIGDQLRMGIRGIELDVHPEGGQVVLCHGEPVDLGVAVVHAGCSVDRPFSSGLQEVRDFLDQPGNEREVVLLYLENNLDGDPTAHDQVAAALDAVLGDLVERPPVGAGCTPMPMDETENELLARGHRVLIVGNCGPGAWDSWVFERGPQWDESGLGTGYPPWPSCVDVDRATKDYEGDLIRVYEDSTWLSAMADGIYRPMTADDITSMVRCGVDLIGLDRVVPDDGRLEAFIWSWAPDEPSGDPALGCVAWGPDDARFRSAACDDEHGYACRTAAGDWVVPGVRGPRSDAGSACASVDAAPATPPTGWEDERLRAAAGAAGQPDLWLSIDAPSRSAALTDTATADEGARALGDATLPATGSDPPFAVVAGLVLVALLASAVAGHRPA
jgi:hypothetical protein